MSQEGINNGKWQRNGNKNYVALAKSKHINEGNMRRAAGSSALIVERLFTEPCGLAYARVIESK